MTAGERFKNWIDGLAESWKDRLRGWFASWVMDGIIRVMDFLEPDLRAEIKPSLLRIRDIPGLPEDFISLIDKTLTEPKAIHLAAILPYLVGILIGLGMGAAAPAARMGSYQIDRLLRSARLDPITAIRALWRGLITEDRLTDSLKDQGWSDLDIETLRKVTLYYPGPTEVMTWAAREVFEPKLRERFQLDKFLPPEFLEWAAKVGVTGEVAKNYWASHWVLPSLSEVIELWRRKIWDKETVDTFWTELDMVPWVREDLFKLFRAVPTRVDVRRFWDMRTIDEARLREIYQAQGYWEKDLEDYVLWTKVYVAFPDLMARWTKGWITKDDVRAELTGLGMPAARVEEMIQTKIKKTEPERVEEGRTLTKTEIYKGVKKELITWGQGIELLMDLGYDEDEADYILAVNVGVLEGSPETFEEFKDWTTKYKIATGREVKPMPEELKKASEEVVRLTGEVEALKLSIVEEKRGLIAKEEIPAAVTKRLKGLQVKLHRAESTLSAAKSEYDRLVAEWKHEIS